MSHKDGRVVLSAWVEPALRDYAREAARRSGLEFSRWVERAVRQTMVRESADRALADARERGECSSCEKLRALSRSCEYVVKATEAGDVSELWAVRFDAMGRPYNSRIGVTSHGVAALVAATDLDLRLGAMAVVQIPIGNGVSDIGDVALDQGDQRDTGR